MNPTAEQVGDALDVAPEGERFLPFALPDIGEEEIDEVVEELVGSEFTRDERRELEGRLAKAQRHIGETCALEVAFPHNSHLYVYEAHPDWYEDFLDACEEITAVMGLGDDVEESSDGLGGYYSNN